MRLILIRPSSDPPAADVASYVAAILLGSVARKVSALGIPITDLVGNEASLEQIRRALTEASDGGAVLAFAGHGVADAWLRRLLPQEVLLSEGDLKAYRGLRVYAHACRTASSLGPSMVKEGSVQCYVGYSSEIIIYYFEDTLRSPKGFAETVAAGVEGSVSEFSAVNPAERLESEYQRWINYWRKKRRPDLVGILRTNLRGLEACH